MGWNNIVRLIVYGSLLVGCRPVVTSENVDTDPVISTESRDTIFSGDLSEDFIEGDTLPIPQAESLRNRLKSIYTAEIGVVEATGNNDGVRISEYLHFVGFSEGNEWCAAFVSWGFNQAEIPAIRSAWSPSWFPMKNRIYERGKNQPFPEIKPGMVLGLYYNNLKRIGHVGFLDGEDANNVKSIEGNVRVAGKQGVFPMLRSKNSVHMISNFIQDEEP